jgi:signal transduction histidine kinase
MPVDMPAPSPDPMDHLPVPALQLDAQGRPVAANAAAVRWLGRTEVELQQAPLAEALPCAPLGPFGAQAGVRCGCGRAAPCWTATVARSLVDDGHVVVFGPPAGAQAELELLREQLVLADRMVTMGALAAGVAHEVNNPLAYILSNLQFCKDGIGVVPPDELQAALQDAQVGAERIRVLARDLQAFSKPASEARTLLEPRRAVEIAATCVHSELRRRAQLSVEVGKTPLVLANEARLAQVVIQLLLRASGAIEPGRPTSTRSRCGRATWGGWWPSRSRTRARPSPRPSCPTSSTP